MRIKTTWTAARKVALILAVRAGAMSLTRACELYEMAPEEFLAWEKAFNTYGEPGLRSTRPQVYRDPADPRHRRSRRNHVALPPAADGRVYQKGPSR
jgi:hypothetical protein